MRVLRVPAAVLLLAVFLVVGPVAESARGKSGAGKAVQLTVAASGDILIHEPVWERARANGGGGHYDFRPMLRYVRPAVRGADVALCHVETPMSRRPPAGYPKFNTPPALADAIRWAGYDVCSTASNHSVDQGQFGIRSTAAALDRKGIPHTGSFGSARAQERSTIVTVKGVKVAFLAYTEMTNGISLPHPWSVNIARADRILADARRARRRGAQVVVVNLHWGAEYRSAPSRFQRRLADRLTRSNVVTAVVGQHAHVVQPIARVNGRLVVFGEGNLLSNQSAECCPAASQDGLIAMLRISVSKDRAVLTRADYLPVWVRRPDYAVLPVGLGLRRQLAPRRLLRASKHRTVAAAGRGSSVSPLSGQR